MVHSVVNSDKFAGIGRVVSVGPFAPVPAFAVVESLVVEWTENHRMGFGKDQSVTARTGQFKVGDLVAVYPTIYPEPEDRVRGGWSAKIYTPKDRVRRGSKGTCAKPPGVI